jgi:O-antigen ligase
MNTDRQPLRRISLQLARVQRSLCLWLSRCPNLPQFLFSTLLILTLATPSWRVGPFSWWPVWRMSMLAGRPADLGFLCLLPGLLIIVWIAWRLLVAPRRRWSWGKVAITAPLAGLTVLALAGLETALTWRTVTQALAWGLFWLVFLFVANEKPNLTLPLALVILIQAAVGIGQFLIQSDLGLAALGELSLDPTQSGTSVVFARGERWLRGYGLTAHPNFLGATLTVLLLMLLPAIRNVEGRARAVLTLVIGVGLLGLLTTFSRASWLGFAAGQLVWLSGQARHLKIRTASLLLLIIPVLFLLLYHDVVLGRFLDLETVLEARSLDERWRDIRVALELIGAHPWRGVGSGNELAAARLLEPHATSVHNVPLLVGAELGWPGMALWLWLAVAGLCTQRLTLAPWLAILVIGLFDNAVWLTTSWRAAILVAVVVAQISQSRAGGAKRTS